MELKSQKHLFSIDSGIHYLNCAYKAPLLKAAEEAAIRDLIKLRNPANLSSDDFFDEVDHVRELFADLVNSLPSNIAILPSTSYGFSSVLNNIKAKPNGHAITLEDEFPSGYFSLKVWCEENENELKVVGAEEGLEFKGKSWNENLLNQINEQTSVVLMSSIHWMNGIRFDLEQIGQRCKEVGALLIVDGTQSVGVLEMDVERFNIDVLVCASYKWLFGPYSVVLAHIGSNLHFGQPLEESWMNRKHSNDFSALTNYEKHYRRGAKRYDVGETSNFILMSILKSALTQLLEWQPKRIEAYCKKLLQPLKAYLEAFGLEFEEEDYFSSHLFALELPEDVDEELLKENLAIANIYLSQRGSMLRVSLNVFNEEGDIKRLIQVIESSRV